MKALALCLAIILAGLLPAESALAKGDDLGAARFDAGGNLILPDNFDDWVFIGTSLGMGYSPAAFDPDGHNMFQVARMEPRAYEAFKKTGTFVDGTQIVLHFYGSQTEVSINQTGFVMSGLHMAEIHYKDSQRFPDGFNFFTFNEGDTVAREIGLPNDCVSCHKANGAYDGVFVQFYPPIHEYLPEAVRAKLAQDQPAMEH